MDSSQQTLQNIRIHVKNNPDVADLYAVSPELFHRAAGKLPGLASRLEITFDADGASDETALSEAEILFVQGRRNLADLANRAPRLRWIQATGAGVDRLLPFVPHDVVLTSTRGIHALKGGEYAMTALLMLNHRVQRFVTAQRASRWEQAFSTSIAGKTLLILGVGAVGTQAARLARGFGMRIIGITRSGRPNTAVDWLYSPSDLAHVLPQVDFVLITLPLTDETRGLLGRRELDLLSRHAALINLGRGAVIDNDALADKLWKGELAGAVLDVYPEEPLPPSSPLWSTPDLIMSAHCAVDDARDYAESAVKVFVENLQRYVDGRELKNVVDKNLGY